MLNPLGRNWGPLVNWDSLGKFFAGFTIAWTVILYTGVAWLVSHRQLPYLRMRNLPLVIAAISFLHVYLVKILLAYITNGHFLCSAEFWIMSIYLPLGCALYQAMNAQLLSISTQQRKLLDGEKALLRHREHPTGIRGIWSRWRGLNSLQKTYVFIGIGMFAQVIITAAIYATNEKLQGHWGNIAKPAGQIKCRKGLEWIPSSFWQLFWSCIYGPYILFKVRNIRDTHYWRLQTILCVVSGIPGSPLWLAAVFSPKFKPVNKYWVPPMWLAPGILVMQFCAVFFPIIEYYTSNRLSRSTLAALRAWEDRETWDDTTLGSRSTRTRQDSINNDHSNNTTSTNLSELKQSTKIYTISALEHCLATDPTPLLHFAATKDFTAENIIFLLAVRDWRSAWAVQGRDSQFARAAEIYASSVSEKLAEFPINIEGSIRSRLDEIFAAAVAPICRGGGGGGQQPVDPFNDVIPFADPGVPMSPMSSTARGAIVKQENYVETYESGFGEKVFDAAEKSIKYLVVTNTWRKYAGGMKDPGAGF